MLVIKDKKDCVGCGLCVNVCPKKCITLKVDKEGFSYPYIDLDKCINCGLCNRMCPKINKLTKLERTDSPKVFAAYNKNEVIRLDSTSGGAFSSLAKLVFEMGGYVCGAIYDSDNVIRHIVTNDINDLDKLRSSKYAQSDFQDVFKTIKEKLKENLVLVCATPCQIASLYMYLKGDCDNLITCDFICRGVNSPKVFKMYLTDLENKYHSKVATIKFKDKTYGWHNFSTKITFENGKTYIKTRDFDTFMIGYLKKSAFMRDACYSCSFKALPRQSDFTLADFWGIENINKDFDNDHGTSMILVNSKKASHILKHLNSTLNYTEIKSDDVFLNNICMYKSVPKTKERTLVMENLDNYSYQELSDKYFKVPSLTKRLNRHFKEFLSKVKRKVKRK